MAIGFVSSSTSALWQSQAGQGSSSTDAQYNQFNLGANQPEITKGALGIASVGTASTGATSTKPDTTVAMLSPTAGVGGASTALGDNPTASPSNTGVAGLTINAAKVNVQVGVTSHKITDGEDSTFTKGTLQSSIQQLASQPGTAYIATLQSQLQSNPAFKNPDGTSKVNWQQIDQAHQNWNYESQGLTAAGAAVVALIVAACTAGAGIAALGPMTAGAMGFSTAVVEGALAASTVAGSMVSAAVVAGAGSLITQASISLINNQGDLGKTFQDLGSSQSLKQLATAMVTAGALQGLGSVPLGESGFTLNSINANSSFVSQLGKNLVNNTAGAMISTAINGGSVEKNLQSALVSAFIQTGAAQTANEIGNATMGEGSIKDVFSNSETAAKLANLTAHAIAGCIAGAATSSAGGGNGAAASSGCGAGAIGAAVGEATASLYGRANNTVEVASLVSGIAAVLVGGDANAVNIASAAGGNAAANNYLKHPDRALLDKATLTCMTSGDQNACNTMKRLRAIDAATNKALAEAVNNCSGETCNQIANSIRQLQTANCSAPFNCTQDNATLANFWSTAQAKAQGLQTVPIELVALGGLNIVRGGVGVMVDMYKTAQAGYSLTTAAGTGAVVGGATYTGEQAYQAYKNTSKGEYLPYFIDNYSPQNLFISMGFGALGGVTNTTMFRLSGIRNGLGNLLTNPIESFVIRGTTGISTAPYKKATGDNPKN